MKRLKVNTGYEIRQCNKNHQSRLLYFKGHVILVSVNIKRKISFNSYRCDKSWLWNEKSEFTDISKLADTRVALEKLVPGRSFLCHSVQGVLSCTVWAGVSSKLRTFWWCTQSLYNYIKETVISIPTKWRLPSENTECKTGIERLVTFNLRLINMKALTVILLLQPLNPCLLSKINDLRRSYCG